MNAGEIHDKFKRALARNALLQLWDAMSLSAGGGMIKT